MLTTLRSIPQYAWRAGAMGQALLAEETLAVCRRLAAAGCQVEAAHSHGGEGVVVVDRRPALDALTACSMRADRRGHHYRARLDGVVVVWQEGRRHG